MEAYVGACDWNYEDWIGVFYPKNIPKTEYFSYYCQHFNSIEITSTYYRLPFKNYVKLWSEDSSDNFKFSFRLNWKITHQNMMSTDEKNRRNINQYFERLDLLKNKIATIVIHPSPKLDLNFERFQDFIEILPQDWNYTLELKKPEWGSHEMIDYCNHKNVTLMWYSTPKVDFMPETHGKTCYVRFDGKTLENRYLYTADELKYYADEIMKHDFNKVYAFFNNPSNGFSIDNAMQFKQLLNI